MRNSNRTRHHLDRDTRRAARDRGKPNHLERLLAQRDHLANAVYEAQAHGYSNAADAAQLLDATETAIRNLSPARGDTARWTQEDARREHTPGDPRPDTCPTCALNTEAHAGQRR